MNPTDYAICKQEKASFHTKEILFCRLNKAALSGTKGYALSYLIQISIYSSLLRYMIVHMCIMSKEGNNT